MRRKQLTLSQKVFVVKNYYQRSDMDEVRMVFEKLFKIKSKDEILEIFFRLVSEFERTGQVTQQVFYEGVSLAVPEEKEKPAARPEPPKRTRGRRKLEQHVIVDGDFIEEQAPATTDTLADPTETAPVEEEPSKELWNADEIAAAPEETIEEEADYNDVGDVEYLYLSDEAEIQESGDVIKCVVDVDSEEVELMGSEEEPDDPDYQDEAAPEKKLRLQSPFPEMERVICMVCGRNYSPKLINAHMKKHDRQGHCYECRDCDSQFNNYDAFRIHSEGHIPVSKYKFQCPTCSEKFVSQDRLNLHQKDHLSKTFICEWCGMIFNKPDALKLHTRTHTGEKPLKCVVCAESFAFYGSLKGHMKKHSAGTYKCNYCDKVFVYKVEMNNHLREHTGAKPYVCHICNRGCAAPHNLRSHLKLLHKVEMSLEDIQAHNYVNELDLAATTAQ